MNKPIRPKRAPRPPQETKRPLPRPAKAKPPRPGPRAPRLQRTVPPQPRPTPAPRAPQPERLQKLLSRAGISSRRKAEELILEGRVTINGRIARELGTKADPGKDRISVDGRPLRLPVEPTYILLHKPVGVVTTLSDPEGRATVIDILGRTRARVYPVGRLDFHSSGLLLLTDDGELAARLMHPRHGIEREYRAKVKGEPQEEALARLRQGVRIDGGRPARAEVHLERTREGKTWLHLTLREGRHHEVRRMCQAVGLPVEKLRRIRYGPLELGRLPPGESRPLTTREVEALRRAVGL